jgi:molybdate transport repressor ModE-like protein
MDRLRCIQVFAEVARDGSFTGAARRLGMSRANVTKHVAWLEQTLRARLLHRTTTQVGLTEAGASALRSGKHLLERYEEMEIELRDSTREPRGVIRVGTPPSFGAQHLAPLLVAFAGAHPDIQIALSIDDGTANLIAQGLDLSIRIAPALDDASYIAQPLARAPQVLVASPPYLARRTAPRSPGDLVRHNCLVHTLKSPTNIWTFTGPAGKSPVRVRGSICSNLGEVLKQAALMGHGISMHPYYMVSKELATGELQVVLPDYAPPSLDIYVIFSSRQNLPLRVRKLVEFLKDWAKSPPEWARRGSESDAPARRNSARRGPERTTSFASRQATSKAEASSSAARAAPEK